MNKKSKNTKVSKELTRGQVNWAVSLFLIIVAVLFLWFWYTSSYLKSENVFWGTISNNLNTGHVTRTSTQTSGPQKLTQVTNLQFVPVLAAKTTVKLENTETNEKVVTETIGTTNNDYLRYAEISGGEAAKLSKDVVGSWAQQGVDSKSQPQILGDALLGGVLMFGDLSHNQRNQIVGDLKTNKAFRKYDLIDTKTIDGRKVFKYAVVIDIDAYSAVYKTYLKMLGQDKLAEQLNQEKSGATYELTLSINAASRQPISLQAKDNDSPEFYSNFGQRSPIQTPATQLKISELQAKLSGK